MSGDGPKLYVCFEPHYGACVDKLDAWPHANSDRAFHNSRADVLVDSADAEPIKGVLRKQIAEARVVVCFISQTASLDEWIAWELETAKAATNRAGLVGVLLHEHAVYPLAMVNCGAIFVPFRKDMVARAIEWAATERHTSDDFTIPDE